MKPLASLIIPSRGGRHRLPVLLAALHGQTEDDWEAIVVLDGDVDGSADYLRSVHDARVKTIEFAENRGRSAALNAGHEAAEGDVLIRCDDDLEPSAGYVARHLAAHREAYGGVVGLYRNVYPPTRYAEVYGVPQMEVFRQEAYDTPADLRWRYWAGNVSVTREQWQRVGPYDMAFRAYGWEDVDWGYRLHQAGYPVVLDPALETTHHVAATTTRIRALRAYASGAARAKFLAKHGPVLPDPRPSGIWGSSTAALAGVADERVIGGVARAVDVLAPVLPAYVARKAIAFTVESAAQAGNERRPEHDVTTG